VKVKKYLPDTNIYIRALHGIEPEASLFKKLAEKEEIFISPIIIAEFLSKPDLLEIEEKAFNNFIAAHTVISITEEHARIAAWYRKQFLRKTKRTYLPDCFLAAQAKLNRLTIVTNDRNDFPMKDINIVTPSQRNKVRRSYRSN
jgi:predicted nucleic acid-binding protein